MRDLLIAIKAELQSGLAGGKYRTVDVYIANAADDPPTGTRFPAIGIKDGQETVEQQSCNVDEVSQQVDLVLWAEQGQEDTQVMGSATQPGVLQMAVDVENLLRGNTLRLADCSGGYRVRSLSSEQLVNRAGRVAQQKIVTFEYTRQRGWDID
jgi:hypothetical protein